MREGAHFAVFALMTVVAGRRSGVDRPREGRNDIDLGALCAINRGVVETMNASQLARDRQEQAATQEAFEALFEPHYRSIVCFFVHRGTHADDAMDLAQETFLRAFRSFKRYRGEVEPKNWLFIIATNLWRNRHRTHNTQKRAGVEIPLGSESGEIVSDRLSSPEPGPERALLDRERVKVLTSAVDELPPQMRRAVQLRLYQQLKYNEIAGVLQVSLQTVRSTLSQAKARIRQRLANVFPEIDL